MSALRLGALGTLAFAAVSLISSSTFAATVNCPGTVATNDREFTLTLAGAATATCIGFGPGNINGNNDAVNQLGYITLDKSDDNFMHAGILNELSAVTGSLIAGLSGSFSFVAPTGFFDFVIGFKSGNGQLDPDWVAFLLPAGVTSGSWAISGQQALSHVNLYAKPCPTSGCPSGDPTSDPGSDPAPGETPIPGAAFLMGSVLAGGAGFSAWRRRRNKTA